MKKFLSTSLSLMLVIVIAYAGSGINAYSFCCEDCHTFGIEAIVEHKCCDVHNDDCPTTPDQDVNKDSVSESSHQLCEMDRLDFDLLDSSSQDSQPDIKTPILKSFITATFYSLIQVTEYEPLTGLVTQTQRPPNLSKLVYFSLLETLII